MLQMGIDTPRSLLPKSMWLVAVWSVHRSQRLWLLLALTGKYNIWFIFSLGCKSYATVHYAYWSVVIQSSSISCIMFTNTDPCKSSDVSKQSCLKKIQTNILCIGYFFDTDLNGITIVANVISKLKKFVIWVSCIISTNLTSKYALRVDLCLTSWRIGE